MTSRRSAAAAATVATLSMFTWGASAHAQTVAPALPSGIGNETPMQILVSPAYTRTHALAAVASNNACNCVHLWTSHDAGSTWQQAAATGWSPGRVSAALDRAGHEILFTSGNAGVQRSDDFGASWTTVSAAGMASPSPQFSGDGLIAVAGQQDYVLRQGATTPVTGSGGRFADYAFLLTPSFPGGGGNPPALLSAYDTKAKTAQVLRCTAALSCSTPVPLPGPPLTGAPLLFPSSAYQSDGAVFAMMAANIYKSTDGGATFAPLQVGQPADVTGTNDMALVPDYQEHGTRTVFAAIVQWNTGKQRGPTFGGVYRSSDGGSSWVQFGAGGPTDRNATAVAVTPDGRVLAGYAQTRASGLVCWTGSAWAAACSSTSAAGAGAPVTGAHCSGAACAGTGHGATATRPSSAVAPASTAAATTNPGRIGAVANAGSNTSTSGSRAPLVGAAIGVMLLLGGASAIRRLAGRRRERPAGR